MFSSLFLTASNLDNLNHLDFGLVPRTYLFVSSLTAYISRAKQLMKLWVSFEDEDADLSTLVESIINSKSIQFLDFDLYLIRENDTALLFDLITKARSVNQLYLMPAKLATDDIYRAFEHLGMSDSIVKFCILPSNNGELILDYDRIAKCIAKSRTVNDVDLDLDDFNDLVVDAVAVDKMLATCGNLDKLTIGEQERTRSRQDNSQLQALMNLARTFASSKMTKKTPLPRELFNMILYQGFKHLNWADGQLSVVVRALSDRRTLSHVQNGLLPLSCPYLYVRCRDALGKVKSNH